MSIGSISFTAIVEFQKATCDLCWTNLSKFLIGSGLLLLPDNIHASCVPKTPRNTNVYRMDDDLDDAGIRALAESQGWLIFRDGNRTERVICQACRMSIVDRHENENS